MPKSIEIYMLLHGREVYPKVRLTEMQFAVDGEREPLLACIVEMETAALDLVDSIPLQDLARVSQWVREKLYGPGPDPQTAKPDAPGSGDLAAGVPATGSAGS